MTSPDPRLLRWVEAAGLLVNNIGLMLGKSFAQLEALTSPPPVRHRDDRLRVGARCPAGAEAAVALAGDASVINISSVYSQVSPDARLYSAREQQSPFHYGPAKASGQLPVTLRPNWGLKNPRQRPGARTIPQPGKMPPGLEGRLAERTMLNRSRPTRGDRRSFAVPGVACFLFCYRDLPQGGRGLDRMVTRRGLG
jgi:hypothetical protein